MAGALLSRQTTMSGRYSDITGVILSSLPAMRAALDAGNYRITELLAGLHVNYLVPDLVGEVDRDGKALINLNTPQEYQQCIRSTI